MCAWCVCLFVGDIQQRVPYTGLSHITQLFLGRKASWSLPHPNILEIGVLGHHLSPVLENLVQN